jgi:glycosyl transferase family 25
MVNRAGETFAGSASVFLCRSAVQIMVRRDTRASVPRRHIAKPASDFYVCRSCLRGVHHMLPVFYINLAIRPDRRDFMENQLRKVGIEGKRIEAVTPADINPEDIARYCNGENPSFLRKNELACTMSHERCWQTMLDMGAERALIFEDDAKLSSLLPAFINTVDAIDAELIRIDALGGTIRVYPVHETTPSGIALRRFRSTPIGAAGYVISRSAARKFLGHPALRRRPVDLVLYDPFEAPGSLVSRVLTDPALCQQIGEQDQRVGTSNIVPDGVRHTYAELHPIMHWSRNLSLTVRRGLRNAADHFVQRRKGLERRRIPLAPEN